MGPNPIAGREIERSVRREGEVACPEAIHRGKGDSEEEFGNTVVKAIYPSITEGARRFAEVDLALWIERDVPQVRAVGVNDGDLIANGANEAILIRVRVVETPVRTHHCVVDSASGRAV